MNWPAYNQSLVKRGEILLGFDLINNWDNELKEMNQGKIGEPFHIEYFSSFTGLCQSILSSTIQANQRRNNTSSCQRKSTINSIFYNYLQKRINRLDIKINYTTDSSKNSKDEYIVITIDSIGIKVTNSGQWMREKWHIKNRGYLKIHIAVNVKTKKILSMKVTDDEHVHDSKALPELVENIIKSDNMVSIGKLFGDGAYEGNNIFRCLDDNGIQPCIKVRKNARVRWKKGNILRNLSVLVQRNDLQNWKGIA